MPPRLREERKKGKKREKGGRESALSPSSLLKFSLVRKK